MVMFANHYLLGNRNSIGIFSSFSEKSPNSKCNQPRSHNDNSLVSYCKNRTH